MIKKKVIKKKVIKEKDEKKLSCIPRNVKYGLQIGLFPLDGLQNRIIEI